MNEFDISCAKVMGIAFCAALGWELGKTASLIVDKTIATIGQRMVSSSSTRNHKDPVFED